MMDSIRLDTEEIEWTSGVQFYGPGRWACEGNNREAVVRGGLHCRLRSHQDAVHAATSPDGCY
jgi:hypothetical protein